MADEDPRQQELIGWLRSQGHTDEQIDQVLSKVAEYDSQTMHESVFDSIDSGNFDIQSLIDDALDDQS